jgi:formiminoglutamase
MIDLKDYLDPVSIERPEFEHIAGQSAFSHGVTINTANSPVSEPGKYAVALIGVPESRNSYSPGTSKAPLAIREQLYRLSRIPGRNRIIDLGDMKPGLSFSDTLAGLTDVLTLLLTEKVFPVIVGGSSALITAADRALSHFRKPYTMTTADSRIDYVNEKRMPDSFNYLNTIMGNQKSQLDHYINIGYQTYLNDQQVINRFMKKKAELVRIGDVRKAIYLMEPLLRDSDFAAFDISSVRQSDAPGSYSPSPNGFYGEEICLLARYAGISDKMKMFGLFDVNPELDLRNQTTALAAQIIWFFLEGFSQKQHEAPSLTSSDSGRFIWYHVRVTDLSDDLIFVKSNLTDRWWMEFPAGDNRNFYIACSHEDYLRANRNEVPERWVRGLERLKT